MVKKQVVLRTDDGDNDMFRTSYVARRRSIRIPIHRQKLKGAVKELYKLRRCVSKGHHKDGFAGWDLTLKNARVKTRAFSLKMTEALRVFRECGDPRHTFLLRDTNTKNIKHSVKYFNTHLNQTRYRPLNIPRAVEIHSCWTFRIQIPKKTL